ncbi:MAG: hypothetical protein H7Y12_06465 [Sphingobacteriaceae bacterium]|nr:hypothetical protein [Cytophagaceae bacterium]
MRSVPFRFLCLLMAALVLTSSTGFAWTEHVCRISQKKTYFFDSSKSCCATGKHQRVASGPVSKNAPLRVKRDGCCAVKTVMVKTTVAPVPVVKAANNAFAADALPPFVPIFKEIAAALVREQTLPPSLRSGAPPLAGRTLLLFVGRWLI